MDYLVEELRLIELRPAMYIGKKSLTTLHDYMMGYKTCLQRLGYSTMIFSGEFHAYAEKRYGKQNSFGWYGLIRNELPDEEQAFDKFFALLHDYLNE